MYRLGFSVIMQVWVTATRNCIPYRLEAMKGLATEIDARKEELRLKKGKNRKYIQWLIEGNW
jgi:hypothetical protein